MSDCSICLDPVIISPGRIKVNGKEAGTRLCCGHIFHKRCIKAWYREDLDGNTCPCCRSPIRFARVSYLYNILILRFWYYRGFVEELLELHDDYIYHDNAGLIMYINDIKTYAMHFSMPFLYHLRNKNI